MLFHHLLLMRSTVYLDGPECKGPLAHARGYVEGTWAREHWHRTSAPKHWHRNIGTETLAPKHWHRTLAPNIGTEDRHRTLAPEHWRRNIGAGTLAPNMGTEHWHRTLAPNIGTEHCHRTLAGMLAPNVYPANVARIVAPRVSKGTESSKPEAGSTRIGL
jgi:hypothetical protein